MTERPILFSGRALTLRNPWPFAVHHLDKRTENRGKPPPAWLVGPDAPFVALHTGAHRATRAERVMLRRAAFDAGWDPAPEAGTLRFTKGGRVVEAGDELHSVIPGVFRILSVDAPYTGGLTGWRVPDCYGYRIDYRPLPVPIACAGPVPKPGKDRSTNLGWWAVPADVGAAIEAALVSP